MRNSEQRQQDYELVQRCLTRDQAAWKQLFAKQQPCLEAALHRQLGPGRHHAELVEEAASRVWLWLVDGDYHGLRVYDPARGQLSTFLGAVSRPVLAALRVERARRLVALCKPWAEELVGRPAPAPLPAEVWEELAASLTPQERRCLDEHLGTLAGAAPPLSATNRRALRMRLRRKVRRTVGDR